MGGRRRQGGPRRAFGPRGRCSSGIRKPAAPPAPTRPRRSRPLPTNRRGSAPTTTGAVSKRSAAHSFPRSRIGRRRGAPPSRRRCRRLFPDRKSCPAAVSRGMETRLEGWPALERHRPPMAVQGIGRRRSSEPGGATAREERRRAGHPRAERSCAGRGLDAPSPRPIPVASSRSRRPLKWPQDPRDARHRAHATSLLSPSSAGRVKEGQWQCGQVNTSIALLGRAGRRSSGRSLGRLSLPHGPEYDHGIVQVHTNALTPRKIRREHRTQEWIPLLGIGDLLGYALGSLVAFRGLRTFRELKDLQGDGPREIEREIQPSSAASEIFQPNVRLRGTGADHALLGRSGARHPRPMRGAGDGSGSRPGRGSGPRRSSCGAERSCPSHIATR